MGFLLDLTTVQAYKSLVLMMEIGEKEDDLSLTTDQTINPW